MPLHLGPLGGMQPINPLKEIDTTSTRRGGVHQSLSGRRTVDYLGQRATYVMRWSHLTPAEMQFLRGIHTRHIRGPLRLVLDDVVGNRLSASAAALGYGGRDMSGVSVFGGATHPSALWPPDESPAGLSLEWSDTQPGHALRLDKDAPVPVLPGETVTARLWMHSTHADDVVLGVNHWTAAGYSGETLGATVTLTPNTWTPVTLTVTPGDGVWAVSPAVLIMAKADVSSVLTLAAAQVVPGSTVGTWLQGGGAPVVAVDQMPTTSLYAPYTRPELTLVEL